MFALFFFFEFAEMSNVAQCVAVLVFVCIISVCVCVCVCVVVMDGIFSEKKCTHGSEYL